MKLNQRCRACRFLKPTRSCVKLSAAVFLLYLLYYVLYAGPYRGTRNIVLERTGRRADQRKENALTHHHLAKELENYQETDLRGLSCQTRPDIEAQWSSLKYVLLVDLELNLVDVGTDCGYLALAAAKFGRHVLSIDENEAKIEDLQTASRRNGLDDMMRMYHFSQSRYLPGIGIEAILKSMLFNRAVVKLQGPFESAHETFLTSIVETMDISAFMVVDNSNCRLFHLFVAGLQFYAVNAYLRPIDDPCRTSGLWLRHHQNKLVPAEHSHAQVNLINPAKVPSSLNYINCIPVPFANDNQICYSTLDIYIGPALERGGWETFIWHPMKKLLDKDPNLGLIDIGANIGVFSISAAAMGRSVLAVEAFYENVQRFSESIRINGMSPLISLVHNAVSDAYETMYFRSPRNNPGGTVVNSNSIFKESKAAYHGKHRTVQSLRLNDLVHLAPKKAIMKIDIEGAELRALRAFDKMLRDIDIVAIFMEWTSVTRQPECMDIVRLLDRQGYKAYGLHIKGWWLKGLMWPLTWQNWQSVKEWPGDIVWLRE